MISHRRKVIGAVAALILVPSLSGCWSGFNAQTSVQANQSVGSGVNLTAGPIEIRGATWVRDVANPSNMTLTATFTSTDGTADRLIKVETDPVSVPGITDGSLEIPAEGAVRTGYLSPKFINAFAVTAFPSQFVSTTLTFERAGAVTGSVLTVANTGQYAGVVVDVEQQIKVQKVLAREQALIEGDEEAAAETEDKASKLKKKKAAAKKQAATGD